MTNRKIRIRLKELLQERFMSQAELSRSSGVREEVISRLVNNRYERIQLDHILSVMIGLNLTSFDQLLEIVWEEEDT